jgi:uncharacterized protein
VTERCYLDTSALAKWYLPETGAAEFERFLVERGGGDISSLCGLELRCTLARRRRAGEIKRALESEILATFREDVASGVLRLHPIVEEHVQSGIALIDQVGRVPLRSLDALHLAIALGYDMAEMATADAVMRRAARQLGITIHYFG